MLYLVGVMDKDGVNRGCQRREVEEVNVMGLDQLEVSAEIC